MGKDSTTKFWTWIMRSLPAKGQSIFPARRRKSSANSRANTIPSSLPRRKARHPDWRDRFFNVGFILDPRGEVILQHYKVSPLFPVEHSMGPHDIYDWCVQKYGRTLQAFWPVV